MLAGNLSQITPEQNFNRMNDISYNTYEGFIQDSWKVTTAAHHRSRAANDALHSLDRTVKVLDIPFSFHLNMIRPTKGLRRWPDVLRISVAQPENSVPLGGFPTRGTLLAAPLRRGL